MQNSDNKKNKYMKMRAIWYILYLYIGGEIVYIFRIVKILFGSQIYCIGNLKNLERCSDRKKSNACILEWKAFQ